MAVYANKGILSVKLENIPRELKARPQWVVWKAVGEKPDKIPFSAHTGRKASSTNLLTWSSFEEARETLETGEFIGLGFVFCSGDPYTGLDLDDCVDLQTGQVAAWAREIVGQLDSYAELSASGTGVHVIVRGDVPNRRKGKVEIYSSKRFFIMTGHLIGGGDD